MLLILGGFPAFPRLGWRLKHPKFFFGRWGLMDSDKFTATRFCLVKACLVGDFSTGWRYMFIFWHGLNIFFLAGDLIAMVMFHTSKCLDASQDAIVIGFGAMPKPSTLWQSRCIWDHLCLQAVRWWHCCWTTKPIQDVSTIWEWCWHVCFFVILSSLKFGTWPKWSLSWKRRFLLEY